MRTGIQESQYVLLMGTNRYAERTKSDSDTNVRRELDFALAESKKSDDFLLPLMLEGDYGTTFPSVGKYLIRDGRSWYSLEQGQWQSLEGYIKEFTQCEPLGILPCLLGLNRRTDHREYRQACLERYKQHQQSLIAKLELRQRQADDNKQAQSRSMTQLTPVLQIPFQALEYDKKADKIGSGSYGAVYRGWWQETHVVAIKELTGTLTAEAEKDLFREAGIMAHLTKTSKEPYHTVRLFGLAVEKPNYALIMEYVPNGTLFELLQNEQELPWDLRCQLAMDIVDGIDFLHRQSIFHRDLRSHNVLLSIFDDHLRAKLSDFGLSTVKSSVRTTSSQRMNSAGTVAWMAPELFERRGQPSAASDIYSYGMVLWELLTHKIPFAKASSTDIIRQWVKDGEREDIPGDCPPAWAKLIQCCWEAKPEDRIKVTEIQRELTTLVKVYPFSFETQAIVETLKKVQIEKDEKWNARWKEKRFLAEQKKKEEEQRQLEIQKIQKEMEELRLTNHRQKQQLEIQTVLSTIDMSPSIEPSTSEVKTSINTERSSISMSTSSTLSVQSESELRNKLTASDQKQAGSSFSPLKIESMSSQDDRIGPRQQLTEREEGKAETKKIMETSQEIFPHGGNRYLLCPAQPMDQKAVERVLRLVAEGEQDKVEALIKKNPRLMMEPGRVTDLSGREFKQITAFRYAVWALDIHMWEMLLQYLPTEVAGKQLAALKSEGTAHGKYYNLQLLIDALKMYVDKFDDWSWIQRDRHWQTEVGKEQKRLPAPVINEYCRKDRPFDPCPHFLETSLPRTRVILRHGIEEEWPHEQYDGRTTSRLFAVGRAHATLGAEVWTEKVSTWGAGCDLKALQTLYQVRVKQFNSLMSTTTSSFQTYSSSS